MKKILLVILCFAFIIGAMSGCESEGYAYHRNGGHHYLTHNKGTVHWVTFHGRRYGKTARRVMRNWSKHNR